MTRQSVFTMKPMAWWLPWSLSHWAASLQQGPLMTLAPLLPQRTPCLPTVTLGGQLFCPFSGLPQFWSQLQVGFGPTWFPCLSVW